MGTDKEPAAGKEFNAYVDFDNDDIISKDHLEKLKLAFARLQALDLENNEIVPRDQLHELLVQMAEYKEDIVALVNVFRGFAGLFDGKGIMSVVPVITKMMKDKNKMAELSGIVQIIDKYTQKTIENNN